MKTEIFEVKTKRDRKKFILLPEKLHATHEQWVHPLYIDEFSFFDPERNPSFQSCDTIMLLSRKNGKINGRIMGIINHAYNELNKETNARFCFLDAEQDYETVALLLQSIEEWAVSKGMNKLVGPLAFSDKEPQGMLIEGFNERVVLATNCNFEWLPQMLEQYGFGKEKDLVSYLIPVPENNPRFLEVIGKRAATNGGWNVLNLKTKKQLKPWVVPVFRLINDAYKNIYGFTPLSEEEMREYAKRYIPVLDPRFVKIVGDENYRVYAFVISLPEIGKGIKKAKGRLFPFGWYHILQASKKSDLLTLLLGAVDEQYRNKGLDALLAMAIFEEARNRDLKQVDSHLILENNKVMRAECERNEGRQHKRYRIFSKPLL